MSSLAGSLHSALGNGGSRDRTRSTHRCGPLGAGVWRVAPLALIAIVLAFAAPLAAGRDDVGGKKSFTTFTQNAYVGSRSHARGDRRSRR